MSRYLICALLIVTSSADAEEWTAGVHYAVLKPAVPTQAPPGKVEVLEMFTYTYPDVYELHPYLQEWLRNKPDYMEYRRLPQVNAPHTRPQARMYFVFMTLDRSDLHGKYIHWMFHPHRYPIYHTFPYEEKAYFELNRAFAKANGIDVNQFAELYHSETLEQQVNQAELEQHRYDIDGEIPGVPAFVVNGRYVTSPRIMIRARCNGTGNVAAYKKCAASRTDDLERVIELVQFIAAQEAKAL